MGGELPPNVLQANAFDGRQVALAVATIRVAVFSPPKFQHGALSQIVVQRADLLHARQTCVFELICGEMGALDQVGINRHRLVQLVGRHRATETRVRVGHRSAVVDSQILQIVDELPAIARPATPLDHFARDIAQTQQRRWIARASRRYE